MKEIYHPVHLLLLYTGFVLIFLSVLIEPYWMVLFSAGLVLSILGMGYYFLRVL